MRKGRLIFIGVFLFFYLVCSVSAIDVISNFSFIRITSYVTVQPVDVGVRVLGIPTLMINIPESGTYLTNDSLGISYSVSDDLNNAWYTLDGSAPVPIPGNSSIVYFNTSDGVHNLAVYANNSMNTTVKSVQFSVDSSKLKILYGDYCRMSYSGTSTDFYLHTFEKLQNMSGITLENINYGKVRFDAPINISTDRNKTDKLVDIESNIKIEYNKIGVNRDELPNFNVSATLWLYHLNFTNPRVVKDGVACYYYACPIEDYTDGVLRFRVSKFSNYSVEESPESQVIIVGGGGGGGGGGGTRTIYINETYYVNITNEVDIGKYFCGLVINETSNGTKAYCGRCSYPYIVRGTDCCLDGNSNGVCDADEGPEVETPSKASAIPNVAATSAGGLWTPPNIILLMIAALLAVILTRLFVLHSNEDERKRIVNQLSYVGR